jgi:hypothetical protein
MSENVIISRPHAYARLVSIIQEGGPGDVEMANGLEHACVLKIGFLNDNVEKNLDAYKQAYDVVILNDGKMDFVNDLLKEILK